MIHVTTKNTDGTLVTSTWHESASYEGLKPITQVYGICFTRDGKIVVGKVKDWNLPGGSPEKGETPDETLQREAYEEVTIVLGRKEMIGYHEIFYPGNKKPVEGEHFFQLRYVALIERIEPLKPDPAYNITWERKLIEPQEFNDYIKWGHSGEAMFKVAYKHFLEWKKHRII